MRWLADGVRWRAVVSLKVAEKTRQEEGASAAGLATVTMWVKEREELREQAD